MTRRLIALAAAALACTATGCIDKGTRPDGPVVDGEVVKPPPLSQASGEAAERVDHVGSDLLTATAIGIPDIDFFTIGSKETELYHQNGRMLYISEGLVNKCKTDDELAAVLATEVGRMTAEFRRGVRKQLRDPMPAVASAPKFDGSSDLDPSRAVYLAAYEEEMRRPAEKQNWPTVDPHEIAAELLRNAGREPKLLTDVAPLVKAGSHVRRPGAAAEAPGWAW
jgi:hypothetical protein